MRELVDMRILLDWVGSQDIGMGIMLMMAACIFLMRGWRMPRFLIAMSFAVLAGGLAIVLELNVLMIIGVLLAGIALGVVLSMWANRVAVILLTGTWGALLIGGAFVRIDASEGVVTIVATTAFAVAIALAATAINKSVAFVTSVEGSILMVAGGLIVLADTSSWYTFIRDAVANNLIFLPFLLLVGIASGYYFQLAAIQESKSGMAGN
jgi:hypothetical protein